MTIESKLSLFENAISDLVFDFSKKSMIDKLQEGITIIEDVMNMVDSPEMAAAKPILIDGLNGILQAISKSKKIV